VLCELVAEFLVQRPEKSTSAHCCFVGEKITPAKAGKKTN
jgi:hypothetical protein